MKLVLHISEEEFDDLVKKHPEFKSKYDLADYLNGIQPAGTEIDFVRVERPDGDRFDIWRQITEGTRRKNMTNDEILIIQYPFRMTKDRQMVLHRNILEQKATGVILLPDYCKVITKPKDIDIRVEMEEN